MMSVLFTILCSLAFLASQENVHNLDDKIGELRALTKKQGFANFDQSSLKYFAEDTDRNYSIFVFFRIKGYNVPSVFHNLAHSFNRLASSMNHHSNKNITHVFFAKIIDNKMAEKYCKKFGYQLIPLLVHFPPHGEPVRKDLFDIRWNEANVDSVTFWVRARTLATIHVPRQISLLKLFLFASFVILGISIYYYAGDAMASINTKFVWSGAIIVFVALIQGGFMYVLISNSPFVGGDGKNVRVISSGLRGQFGIESYIVALIYIGIVTSLIHVNDFLAKSFNIYKSIIGFFSLIFFVSLYVLIFRAKVPWMFG